jgi:hypothetical protein
MNEWMKEWMRWMNLFEVSECVAHGGMILTGENRRARRETCPSARAAAVTGRRLTAWAMARPRTMWLHFWHEMAFCNWFSAMFSGTARRWNTWEEEYPL